MTDGQKDPAQAGVPERTPDETRIEGARTLADEAREALHARGFDDEAIRKWAETYIDRQGSGSLDDFLGWVDEQADRV